MDIARRQANVAALCQCGHIGVLDGSKLWRFFTIRRWETAIHRVARRLRCSVCGRRAREIRMSNQRPHGPDWGPRTQAEWERLVARLRG